MKLRALFLVVLLAASMGCGKDEPATTCSTSADCSSDELCQDGECTAVSEEECSGDPDCPGGYVCVSNMCQQIQQDMGPSNNGMPDMGNNEVDMNNDNIAPTVTMVTPAAGTEGIAVDTSFTVTFSESLRPTSVNIQNLALRDASNTDVAAMVTYDDATKSATLTPSAPLAFGAPYRLVANEFIRDPAGNPLAEQFTANYYTVFEEPAGVAQIARDWAPVIYQSLGSAAGGVVNTDIPTKINFDNNFTARDNKENAQRGTTRTTAAVYYNVIESKTHYYVLYVLYYPMRKDTAGESFEHDFTGMVMVLAKGANGLELKLVEGVDIQTGTDAALGFKPQSSDVQGIAAPQNLETFDDAAIMSGRYPLFIPSGEHEACNWAVDGRPPHCPFNAGEFPNGNENAVIMRPGMVGQQFAQAVDPGTGIKEMTYELLPLGGTLWAHRVDVGTEALWQQTNIYQPEGMDRPTTTTSGSPVVLPNRLSSDDETTFGKPPFQWLQTSAAAAGQWLLDPAYVLPARYGFGDTWSLEYCYNVFFDLNLRGHPANPECDSD